MINSIINTDQLNRCTDYDVLIIGTGIAGLYTALTLDQNQQILLVTKDQLYESNSNYAQGGIAAAVDKSDFETHVEDTLKAGSNYNDAAAVNVLVRESRDNINQLIDFGVNFDKTDNGELLMTKEGGHSTSRILHYKDSTGHEIIRALTERVKEYDNINILEDTFAIDFMIEQEQCTGVIFQKDNEIFCIHAKKTIIASGGIGRLYKNSTNSLIATGDGIAMALRADVKVIDMEFVQFHPTALNIDEDRNFLISEALRGEGAILRNSKGEAFMEKYHELKDLAPRDIVSQSIFEEMEQLGDTTVYLDITMKSETYLSNRFPEIYTYCLEKGINIAEEYIPVVPVQHYLMGGIKVDLHGRTSLDNLYACGEVSRTGVHGANRLASNSLLEAIVLGNRVSKDINIALIGNESIFSDDTIHSKTMVVEEPTINYTEIINQIREIMSKKVFIVRYQSKLSQALSEINDIYDQLIKQKIYSIDYYQALNMAMTSRKVIEDALNRDSSLGSHKIIIDE